MVVPPIRVVVVDDHLVTCEGIVTLLGHNPRLSVVGVGLAGEHVLSLLRDKSPDVLLVDLQMPMYADRPEAEMFQPMTTLEEVIEAYPQTAVIVISQEQDSYTISSLAEIGVKGYFLKSDQLTRTLGAVVEQIYAGGTYFSPAVREIIEQMPKLKRRMPLTNALQKTLCILLHYPELKREDQAAKLSISPVTLQKHINSLFEVFCVNNVESVLIKAIRMGVDKIPVNNLSNGMVGSDEWAEDNAETNPPLQCPRCGSTNINKNGLTNSGKQKYYCKVCCSYGTFDQMQEVASPE